MVEISVRDNQVGGNCWLAGWLAGCPEPGPVAKRTVAAPLCHRVRKSASSSFQFPNDASWNVAGYPLRPSIRRIGDLRADGEMPSTLLVDLVVLQITRSNVGGRVGTPGDGGLGGQLC